MRNLIRHVNSIGRRPQLLEEEFYDPWGETRHFNESGGMFATDEIADANLQGKDRRHKAEDQPAVRALSVYRYAGQVWDKTPRMYYMTTRYCDPEVGGLVGFCAVILCFTGESRDRNPYSYAFSRVWPAICKFGFKILTAALFRRKKR